MIEPSTHTLEVPGATLAYDLRDSPSPDSAPVLLMIGSPMGAAGFGTLSGHFTDRTVVTYDPRGVERSTVSGDAEPATPMAHAGDLHRLVSVLDRGPVDVFASSGGAVNALAWLEQHSEDVGTLVAHEPPLAVLLPDRDVLSAATKDIYRTYQDVGRGPAMAKFIQLVSYQGVLAEDYLDQPDPDPALFGLPSDDDGTRDDPLFGVNMATQWRYNPDFELLRAVSTRILPAVGAASEGVMTYRSGVAVAHALGVAPVIFPGGHDGFLGGEFGQTGEPDAFAQKLREVLGATA